ncbi:MAG TPA: DUF362 domain-containing protein [Ignavibacteriaceae bacterium]|nr:DUF362 domain-containing protein [Ignavibacteriaceae bacterium]
MKRREFLNKSIQAAIIGGAAMSLGNYSRIFPYSLISPVDNYTLAAIKGGEPDVMFDEAIKALGGMKKFVKKGQTVVVKPNIGWDVSPDRAGNTNPLLVNRIIKHCFEAGAKDVFVFDHTCDNWNRCYSNSGIERSVKDAGGKIVSGANESYYQNVTVKQGKKLKNAKVHELILSSDVFINVPILKHHSSAELTIGMKNLMGVVWDRGYWHSNNLNQCISDFASFRKPDLTVVDAYYVMKKNGPRGVSKDDVITLKSQIVSTDIVAADAAAAKLFGTDPSKIDYIKFASEMNIGVMDLDKISIYRKIF